MQEILPQLRHAADPSYLSGDWFVSATAGLNTARGWYTHLLAPAIVVFGETVTLWILQLVVLAALAWATYAWAAVLRQSAIACAAAACVVTTISFGTLGSSDLLTPNPVPSSAAWAILAWGAVAIESRRYLLAGLLLALTTFVHAQLGIGVSALFLGWVLLRPDRPSARQVGKVLLGLLPGLVAIAPAALSQVDQSVTSDLQFQILAVVRHPWHFLPSTWSAGEWLSFATGLTILVALLWGHPRRRSLAWLVAIVVFVLVLAWITAEVVRVLEIVKLQPFRLSAVLQIPIAIAAGSLVATLWASPRDRILAAAVLVALPSAGPNAPIPTLAVGVTVLAARFSPSAHPRLLSAILLTSAIGACAVAVAEALMAGTWWLPVAGASAVAAVGLTDLLLQDRDRKWSAYFGGAAVAGTGVALLLLQAIAFGATRPPTDTGLKPLPLHGTLVPAGSLDAAALWARDSTPAAARFLIPPDYGEFRVLASRAIVIDFKAFTFAPSAMVIWLQRIDAVCGRELRLGQEWSTEVREAYAERT
jgi:hypothetical protein